MRYLSLLRLTMIISLFIVLSTCATLFYVVHTPAQAASANAGTHITLSTLTDHPLAQIQITGTGFGSQETISIAFDTTQVGSATTGKNGDFSTKITIPATATPGSHFMWATGQTSGRTAKAKFLVQTNWSFSGFDAQNRRYNPYENVLSPTNVAGLMQDWVSTPPDKNALVTTQATVVNNVLYVGENKAGFTSRLSAYNATTGATLWHYDFKSQISSTPAVSNGVVYIGSDVGKLFAFNAASGSVLWTVQTLTNFVDSSPTVANGVVYFSAGDGMIYAVNAQTGTILWTFATRKSTYSSPAVVGGIVYATSEDRNVYALNAQTGKLIWSFTTGVVGDRLFASPTVAYGIVYAGSSDKNMYALDAQTGKLVWKVATGDRITGSPAVANGIVYSASNDGYLYAFNAQTGAILWKAAAGFVPLAEPEVANGVVYYTGQFSIMFAFNAKSGQLLWTFNGANGGGTDPTIVNGMVYSGLGGSIYAFHLAGSAA